MRVCEITTIHPQDDARILRSVTSLSKSFEDLVFISTWKKSQYSPDGTRYISMNLPKQRIKRSLHSLKTFIAALKTRADVYHFHDLDFIIYAVLLKFITRKRVIYDCHENYPEEILYNKKWIPRIARLPLSIITRIIENGAAKILGEVIVVTPSQAIRFKIHANKVTLVRNFADIEVNRQENGSAVIYVGGLTESYGVTQIIDIAKQLSQHDIRILVTDRFVDKATEEWFHKQINDNNLNIELIEKVPASQMERILKQAHIGISPSQPSPNTELGYHSKLIEYMACGLPIVASTVEANMFVLREVDCGISVDPKDIQGYVKAIIKIHNQKDIRDKLRENGYRAVEETFSWKAESRNLIRAIEGY